jgi:uncharacterized cofD-like protein
VHFPTWSRGLRQVRLDPPGVKAPPGLADAILRADQVVLGPGSLYTSVLAAAMVDELREALAATAARRVYVSNLRAEAAETKGYGLVDHVDALVAHGIPVDVVVADPRAPISRERPVAAEVVAADVAVAPARAVHDSDKLAAVLARLAA